MVTDCELFKPITPTQQDVEVISNSLVTQLLEHNTIGERVCGWQRPGDQEASAKGLELIKRFEAFSSELYYDPDGNPTIGYGHKFEPGERLVQEVTRAEAEALLEQDIQEAECAVNRLVEVPLTQPQFDALVSFTFNVGADALASSTLLKKLNGGSYLAIPSELLRWRHVGGDAYRGLLRRRIAEAMLWVSKPMPAVQV